LCNLSSRSTEIDESLIRLTYFCAGFPSIGVEPKSISSFYILMQGKIALAFIGISIFLDPLITIVATASIEHTFVEFILKAIYTTSYAARVPDFGEGTIMFSNYFGKFTLKIVGTFD